MNYPDRVGYRRCGGSRTDDHTSPDQTHRGCLPWQQGSGSSMQRTVPRSRRPVSSYARGRLPVNQVVQPRKASEQPSRIANGTASFSPAFRPKYLPSSVEVPFAVGSVFIGQWLTVDGLLLTDIRRSWSYVLRERIAGRDPRALNWKFAVGSFESGQWAGGSSCGLLRDERDS